MHARVTLAAAQPEKLDEVIKIVRDSILPAAKKQKGFKGYLFLTDRKAGKGLSITLWNTEADMTAGEGSGYYREQLAKTLPLATGTPTTEHYEVAIRK